MGGQDSPGEMPSKMTTARGWECHKLQGLSEFLELHTRPVREDSFLLVPFFMRTPYCRDVACDIESPTRRIVKARFSRFIFVAGDDGELGEIKRETSGTTTVEIVNGNINTQKTLRAVFDNLPRSSSCFALIDPGGYKRLRWSTVKKLANYGRDWEGHKTELLIFLPLEMALLRNLTRQECQKSLDRFFGDQEWHEIKEKRLRGEFDFEKTRKTVLDLYLKNLKSLGYRFIEAYQPSGRAFYQVLSASDRQNQLNCIKAAWGRPRYLPCELFYG